MSSVEELELQYSVLPKKYVTVTNRSLIDGKDELLFEDVSSVSFSIQRNNFMLIPISQNYMFKIKGRTKKSIEINMQAPFLVWNDLFKETFNVLFMISEKFIEPLIIDKLFKEISSGDIVSIGAIHISKDGLINKKMLRDNEIVGWDEYYQTELSEGSMYVYRGLKGENPKLYGVSSISVPNSIVLPKLLAKCANKWG